MGVVTVVIKDNKSYSAGHVIVVIFGAMGCSQWFIVKLIDGCLKNDRGDWRGFMRLYCCFVIICITLCTYTQ